MTCYTDMDTKMLKAERARMQECYDAFCAKGLTFDMTRGKPGSDQLDLSRPMLDIVSAKSDLTAGDGTDCRNYGVLDGLPEAKRLIACGMLGCKPENVIVCGNASLNIMYDMVARAELFGIGGATPWSHLDSVKFLCPAPGYDRHFRICEEFGIEMIPIEMRSDGPDMKRVAELVEGNASVKGIWCVPKYANPTGITYSTDTVTRFSELEPAAPDFRIFWDNAYCVHHLYDDPTKQDQLKDILSACAEAGHADMVYEFCSTSKVTFPGAGIAAIAASPANRAEIVAHMGAQTIGHDKLNQLRHVRFLKDANGIAAHMQAHAALIRPKFELVEQILEEDLARTGIARWTCPRGGYFISFDGPQGSAKRIVSMAAGAGVKLTSAGATWPHGIDPHDSNIRLAPTLPPLGELEQAAHIFTVCVRLVALEMLLAR